MVGYDSTADSTGGHPRPGRPLLDDPRPDYATSRKPALIVGAVILGLAAVGGIAAAVFFLLDDTEGDDPDGAAAAYLEAWKEGDFEAMAALADDPPDSFGAAYETFAEDLRVEEASFELGDIEREGNDARAEFQATLSLQGLGEWTYDGSIRLRRAGADDDWFVDWSPAAIHPRQQDGERLTLLSEWPERGTITDADGEPLVSEQPAVLVGIDQTLMTDIEDRSELHEAFEEHLDVDSERVDAAIDAVAAPDHLVEVIEIPEHQFDTVESDLRPVPGIVFRDRALRMGPTEDFAAHLLGHTGEITAELLDELGEPYAEGSIVGLTGLEARFERELAGTPSGEISLVTDDEDEDVSDSDSDSDSEDDSDTEDGEDGAPEDEDAEEDPVVHTFEGTDPVDITTTLDRSIQQAVDAALDDVEVAAGAVVVDREGNIRAASSRPLDDGFNRAVQGNYPPGSTFKVVTTDALLADGLTPDDRLACTQTINSGGREYTNFEDADLGEVPFRTVFAQSCNTAFISAVGDLPSGDLVAATERFGFNTAYSIGLTTAEPSFPEPADDAEQGAAAIGQGRTLASPLHMATVASAINEGTWHPPTLLPDLEASDDAPAPPDSQALDGEAAETISGLMELVVTEGSGGDAAVDGGTVAGKTGTAEFGEGDPLPTHAWFIGFRGDLALALVLEDGGVGGRDAAPVAGEIFEAFPE